MNQLSEKFSKINRSKHDQLISECFKLDDFVDDETSKSLSKEGVTVKYDSHTCRYQVDFVPYYKSSLFSDMDFKSFLMKLSTLRLKTISGTLLKKYMTLANSDVEADINVDGNKCKVQPDGGQHCTVFNFSEIEFFTSFADKIVLSFVPNSTKKIEASSDKDKDFLSNVQQYIFTQQILLENELSDDLKNRNIPFKIVRGQIGCFDIDITIKGKPYIIHVNMFRSFLNDKTLYNIKQYELQDDNSPCDTMASFEIDDRVWVCSMKKKGKIMRELSSPTNSFVIMYDDDKKEATISSNDIRLLDTDDFEEILAKLPIPSLAEGSTSTINVVNGGDIIKSPKTEQNKQLFKRQSQMLKKIKDSKCKSIVKFKGITSNGSLRFQGLLKNNSWMELSNYIQPSKNVKQQKCLTTALHKLVNVVQCLHNKGFAHRDINLHNIMINSKTCDIRLIDFGCASDADSSTLCGTTFYKAPELFQTKSTPYTLQEQQQHDLWALGMVIYKCIHGIFPYEIYGDIMKQTQQQKKKQKEKYVLTKMYSLTSIPGVHSFKEFDLNGKNLVPQKDIEKTILTERGKYPIDYLSLLQFQPEQRKIVASSQGTKK